MNSSRCGQVGVLGKELVEILDKVAREQAENILWQRASLRHLKELPELRRLHLEGPGAHERGGG